MQALTRKWGGEISYSCVCYCTDSHRKPRDAYLMSTRPISIHASVLKDLELEKVAVLTKLDNWPMNIIAEKLISTGHSTLANVDKHILSYKQFMFFQCLHPDLRCGMYSDEVDAVWHQHILFTRDYERFGKEIFGRFIHHTPCNAMDTSPEAMREYEAWILEFEGIFEGIPIRPRIPPFCQG